MRRGLSGARDHCGVFVSGVWARGCVAALRVREGGGVVSRSYSVHVFRHIVSHSGNKYPGDLFSCSGVSRLDNGVFGVGMGFQLHNLSRVLSARLYTRVGTKSSYDARDALGTAFALECSEVRRATRP